MYHLLEYFRIRFYYFRDFSVILFSWSSFLILWILSMFLLSFYLIAVEYGDYKLQEKQKELGVDADVEGPVMDLNKLAELKGISELKLRSETKNHQGAKK